jgi:hypothetical protein
MHSKPLLATKQVKGSCIVSRSFLKLVRIAISPRQAKISSRKSKGIANQRPTFEAFFAVASSLQATKKSRKKDKKLLHFTVPLQNTTARPDGQRPVGSLRSLLPSEVLCS